MVPNEIDLQVGAARHRVHAASGRLQVHVFRNLPGTFPYQHPAVNSPVLELILITS